MNWDVDTLWTPEQGTFVSPFIEFFCGICEPEDEDEEDDNSTPTRPQELRFCQHDYRLGAMAINISEWKDLHEVVDGVWALGSAEAASELKIKELIIFVHSDEAAKYHDVMFYNPVFPPWRMLKALSEADTSDWGDVVSKRVSKMETAKAGRAIQRQKSLDLGVTANEMEYWEHFNDLSSWTIPKIRYVEAKSASAIKNWMIPRHT